MTWAMGLDYLKTLAWPVVTLTLAIVFREPIKAVLMRLTSVNTPLGTAEFDASADQAIEVASPSPRTPASSSALPDYSSEYRLIAVSPALAVDEAHHRGRLALQELSGQVAGNDARQRKFSEMSAALDHVQQQHAARPDSITPQEAVTFVRYVERAHAAASGLVSTPSPESVEPSSASVPAQAEPSSS